MPSPQEIMPAIGDEQFLKDRCPIGSLCKPCKPPVNHQRQFRRVGDQATRRADGKRFGLREMAAARPAEARNLLYDRVTFWRMNIVPSQEGTERSRNHA